MAKIRFPHKTYQRTVEVYNQAMIYFASYGAMPTRRQLCLRTGIKSTSTVNYHLNLLFEMGWLSGKRGFGSGRAMALNRPTERGLNHLEVRRLIDV